MVFVNLLTLFLCLVLMQNGSRTSVSGEDLRRKESFSDYKNIDFKKPQNLHFSKEVSPWFLSGY